MEEESDSDDSSTASDDGEEDGSPSEDCQHPIIELNLALVGRECNFDQGNNSIIAMLEGSISNENSHTCEKYPDDAIPKLNLVLMQQQNSTTAATSSKSDVISKTKKRLIQEI